MAQLIKHATAVVVSDLHVGDPNLDGAGEKRGLDDFTQDKEFERLLDQVIPRRAGWPATLIINGDFIDFIQVMPWEGVNSPGRRFGVTEECSREKLDRVMKAHPLVFDAIGKFLSDGGQVLVLPGNHDIDLHWPGVFGDFRKRVGGVREPQLHFVKEGFIEEQGVYVEHGNQYSFDNKFEFWSDPVRTAPDGERRLERPWGTLFLDLAYNDFKQLYPFSNKIYPQAQLAWIALRSFRDDENVSADAIAQLVAFFALKGKRFFWEHLMGDTLKAEAEEAVPVEEVFKQLREPIGEERKAEIEAKTAEILAGQRIPPSVGTAPVNLHEGTLPGLLGRTDEWGMSRRQTELLESHDVTIVAFGHTHTVVDGNEVPLYGIDDERRVFNTGSWIPNIPIGPKEKPLWSDLAKKSARHDLRYLLLEFEPSPKGRIEPLLAPDKQPSA